MAIETVSLVGLDMANSEARLTKALEHFKATCPYATSQYPVQTIQKALFQRIHIAIEAKQDTVELIAKCCTIPTCPEMAWQRILVRALCGMEMDGGKPALNQPIGVPPYMTVKRITG